MIKKTNNSSGSFNKILHWLTFCVCIIAILFVLIFESISNNTKSNILTQYCYELNRINSNLIITTDFDSVQAKNLLYNGLIELDTLKDKVSLIQTTTPEDTAALNQLIACIDNTNSIYSKYISILNNKSQNTTSPEELKILFDTCQLSYDSMSSYNLNLDLDSDVILFFSNLDNYIYSLNENSTISSNSSNNSLSSYTDNLLSKADTFIKENCSFLYEIKDFIFDPNIPDKIQNKFNSFSN